MAVVRSTEAWQQLFVEYDASDESARDFCARHGVRLVYFYRRSQELRGRSARRLSGTPRSAAPVVTPAFMPVHIPRHAPAEIRLTVGRTEIAVSSAVAPDWVAALVQALARIAL